MSRARAIDLLADALQIDPSEVGPETALGTTPEWDSLAHTRLILSVEAQLGRLLAPEEIVGMTSLQAVIAALDASD